mgnify:CR=1 FL=1|jgi:hypothetical protein
MNIIPEYGGVKSKKTRKAKKRRILKMGCLLDEHYRGGNENFELFIFYVMIGFLDWLC